MTGAASSAHRTERLIAALTPVLGAVAGFVVAWRVTWLWGVGVAIGAALAWLNYRWLEQGVNALARAAQSQHDVAPENPRPRVPVSVAAKFALRYVLIAAAVYVIVSVYKVPVLSVLAGLFALGAAALLAVLYEIFAPQRHGTSL